jgi:hypothetical protein
MLKVETEKLLLHIFGLISAYMYLYFLKIYYFIFVVASNTEKLVIRQMAEQPKLGNSNPPPSRHCKGKNKGYRIVLNSKA